MTDLNKPIAPVPLSEDTVEILAVLSSDWHAAPISWLKRPDIIGDPQFAIEQVLHYSKMLQVPLIAAGDLIDVKKPEPSVMQYLQKQLSKHTQKVLYIQGQHEQPTYRYPTWLSTLGLRDVVYIDSEYYPLHSNIYLIGLDWRPKSELIEALDNLKFEEGQRYILAMHQTCTRFMGAHIACELEDYMLPDEIDLVIIGDYHGASINKIKSKGGRDITIASSGSPRATYFDCWFMPSIQFLVKNTDGTLDVKTKPMIGRTMYDSVPIEGMEQLENYLSRFQFEQNYSQEKLDARLEKDGEFIENPILYGYKDVFKPLLRINIHVDAGNIELGKLVRDYTDKYREYAHFIFRVRTKETEGIALTQYLQEQSDSMIPQDISRRIISAVLPQFADPVAKPELNALVTSLLNAQDDIETTIRLQKSEFLKGATDEANYQTK